MISLLFNGFGSDRLCHEGKDSGQPRSRAGMLGENEFNGRLIIPDSFRCTLIKLELDAKRAIDLSKRLCFR